MKHSILQNEFEEVDQDIKKTKKLFLKMPQ